MDITTAIVIKDRDPYRLERAVKSIKSWSDIIIIDQSWCCNLPESWGNITVRHHPRDIFNMPLAFNTAIQMCKTEYIMFTGCDMLFSPNFGEVLTDALVSCDAPFVMAFMGYLPEHSSVSDPNLKEVWPIWNDLLEEVEDPICHELSTGTQAGKTSFFGSIRGFDERFVGLGGPDSDMMTQARLHGLHEIWIPWDQAQILHQWHVRSPLKGMSSHLIYEKVEHRNPPGWGLIVDESGHTELLA